MFPKFWEAAVPSGVQCHTFGQHKRLLFNHTLYSSHSRQAKKYAASKKWSIHSFCPLQNVFKKAIQSAWFLFRPFGKALLWNETKVQYSYWFAPFLHPSTHPFFPQHTSEWSHSYHHNKAFLIDINKDMRRKLSAQGKGFVFVWTWCSECVLLIRCEHMADE